MGGLAETVEVLVCCVWRQIVDIHDSGMSIPLSLFSMFGWSRIWIASFARRVYQCLSWVMHWTTLQCGRFSASSVCSAIAELSVRISLTSLRCSSILSPLCTPYYNFRKESYAQFCHVYLEWGSYGWTK